ncbi:MAG: hypothetical protein J6T44_11335 [Prevotella sp.]|nr:hypothetical protein [Prevotella sp.]
MAHIDEIYNLGIRTFDNHVIDKNDILYIDVFYTALENVEHRYIIDETPSANANNEVIETSYTSRLVTKINILFENHANNPYGLDCVGPVKKGSFSQGDEANMVIKHPDIVIHKGDYPLTGIQEIMCEIKRSSNLGPSEMIYDLNKLMKFSSQCNWNNPYRVAIFLIYCSTKAQLEGIVSGYRNGTYLVEKLLHDDTEEQMTFSTFVTTYQEQLKNIICFCHSEEGTVELSTVYEIVKSKIIH